MNGEHFYQKRIREELSARAERNPRYSLRALAQNFGFDPGSLSQILSGKRFPSAKLAKKLSGALGLSPDESIEFLASIADAKRDAGLKRISPELRALLKRTGSDPHRPKELSVELFKAISDWYHFAILELVYVDGFISDPKWIANSLGISVYEAQSALSRLIELGLLENHGVQLIRTDTQLVSADRHLTTAAHRKRQKQILERSISSLLEDPIEVRNHTAMTFAIDVDKIPEAKRRIGKFMAEMTEFLQSGEKNCVYEMTVNLYPHQKIQTVSKQKGK